MDARRQAIDELVEPLQEVLDRFQSRQGEVELDRTEAYAGLTEQIKSLAAIQGNLHHQTVSLVQALRRPTVRGRLRPGMVIRRPENRSVVVTARKFTELAISEGSGSQSMEPLEGVDRMLRSMVWAEEEENSRKSDREGEGAKPAFRPPRRPPLLKDFCARISNSARDHDRNFLRQSSHGANTANSTAEMA